MSVKEAVYLHHRRGMHDYRIRKIAEIAILDVAMRPRDLPMLADRPNLPPPVIS